VTSQNLRSGLPVLLILVAALTRLIGVVPVQVLALPIPILIALIGLIGLLRGKTRNGNLCTLRTYPSRGIFRHVMMARAK
jgi:hypothetical protein